MTPLHLAVKHNKFYNIGILVENGADINAMDNSNKSPLILAQEGNKKNILSIFVSKLIKS